jgi:hypothetical protein
MKQKCYYHIPSCALVQQHQATLVIAGEPEGQWRASMDGSCRDVRGLNQ